MSISMRHLFRRSSAVRGIGVDFVGGLVLRCRLRRGFTMVELMVVISIIALLVSLLLPAMQKARAMARTSVCQSQLRQLAIAMAGYHHDHNGVYPHYQLDSPPEVQGDRYWYQKMGNRKYYSDRNVVICPESGSFDSPSPGWTPQKWAFYNGRISYGMNVGITKDYTDASIWPFFFVRPLRQDDIPRSSQTIIATDADYYHEPPGRTWYGVHYIYPVDRSTAAPWDDAQVWPRHQGAANVWWADTHITSVVAPNPSAPETIYAPQALGSLNGAPDYWIGR